MINIYLKKLVDSEAVSSLLILLSFSSILILLMIGFIFESFQSTDSNKESDLSKEYSFA